MMTLCSGLGWVAFGPAVDATEANSIQLPYERPAVRREEADAWVSTREQLVSALAAGSRVIWIENDAKIDLARIADHRSGAPKHVLLIPDGVTLASGRSESQEGGLLYFSRRLDKQLYMLSLSPGTRVTGLRLRGPSRSTESGGIKSTAILVRGVDDVLIDRNEIYDWPGRGVHVISAPNTRNTASRVRITNNFFHHNLQCRAGYGVEIGGDGGYAQIDRNLFNFNRHSVAGDGRPGTGYVAELNFVLSGGEKCGVGTLDPGYYEQHFDMHGSGEDGRGGIAGEYIDIRRNTIRGEQGYYLVKTRPAFYLRGEPEIMAYFQDNAVAHDDQGEAIKKEDNTTNLTVRRNQYDIDTSLELAVGDFDGDGYDDVFQATGAVWAYSARGRSEWRYLNYSTRRLSQLRFGDFDGNGKTDVFTQDGGRWLIAYDGTRSWTPLPVGSTIDMRSYRFGDFDGDGKTDVFLTNGAQWFYSKGGATQWQPLARSGLGIDELRFGDFDGDGATDVFSFANGEWSISKGGAARWEHLNAKISSNLGELVFADFNGDGKTDIARQHGDDWQVSWGGADAWRTLHENAPDHMPLGALLLGDFTGDRCTDALHYERRLRPGIPIRLVFGPRFVMSSRGSEPFTIWSRHDMR
jgi:hypothetical protein